MDNDLRQSIVDQRADVTDPDNWPTTRLTELAGGMVKAQELLRAQAHVAELVTPGSGVNLRVAADSIEKARDALRTLEELSPLGAWRILHVPRLDPLDHVYDCCAADCPVTGFASAEDKALHYRRWDLE